MQKELGFSGHGRPPFWRDERILSILSQVLVVAAVAGAFYFLYSNLMAALTVRFGNNPISFAFLDQTAGFDIKEFLIPYSRESTYATAFLVGLLNTLIVAVLGIVFATLLGVAIGVMRLSANFLVNSIAGLYINIFRNIPLLLLLIFWSQAVFLKLPRVQEAIMFGPVFFSQRGVAVPWGIPTDSWPRYLYVLLGGFALAILVGIVLVQIGKRTGRMPIVSLWTLLIFVTIATVGWFVLPQPLTFSFPELTGFNTSGGRVLSPEFMAILSGLAIYTAAFIAEIVRSGIQAVSKGQREAASALGLTGFQTLRLVIFPQALRVIIPPLTSQYLNLTKNSSLAIAVGYPDLFAVAGNTIRNQTGREIEVFILIMGVYLALSLGTSLIMNFYNRRIKLIER